MSYIEFDKSELINLEYSTDREFLQTNRAGSFSCSTVINCPTRRYHGLLICPLDYLDDDRHLLISALDETIIQHGKEFHLAVRKYPGIFHPGHKYIRDFHTDPIPTIVYRVGGVVLKKETLLAQNEETSLIRYTLEEAQTPAVMRFHPFLAFRNVNILSKSNLDVIRRFDNLPNGIKYKMYEAYPFLHMQMSKNCEWVSAPDWFYDVEYMREMERGYDFQEDLYVPGFFELTMKKGDSVVFSASLQETDPTKLDKKFENEVKKRVPRTSFLNCLENSAEQFLYRHEKGTHIIAGYPWFGFWGRDTFIALPGLTLTRGDKKTYREVLDTMSQQLQDGLFKNKGNYELTDIHSIDASLWYIWAVQQYLPHSKAKKLWQAYGEYIKTILISYQRGTAYNIHAQDNGLLYGGYDGIALTWMSGVVDGKPVTPRTGLAVEVNALWYNAICFALELAKASGDQDFIAQFEALPERIKGAFVDVFWDEQRGYLADYVYGDYTDWAMRPNQVIAASMPYSPIEEEMKYAVLERLRSELLTPRGLRTLSPKHPDYKGRCEGNPAERDRAYHQGSVYPWLLGHFAEAYLKLHQKSGVALIEKLYKGFEPEMMRNGIGTVCELYDGDPPHYGREAVSQAWNVAELLRIQQLLETYR